MDQLSLFAPPPPIRLAGLPEGLRVGTSSFANPGWVGGFYPPGTAPRDFLAFYARHLPAVEIDATWYALPAADTVAGWARSTPPSFDIALKVPRALTHEGPLDRPTARTLWTTLWARVAPLGPRLGPLLLQFPRFGSHPPVDRFLATLEVLLAERPTGARLVVELRNPAWLRAQRLLAALRHANVVLAFTAYPRMPGPEAIARHPEWCTGDFAYVRLLGDHRRMDRRVERARARGSLDRPWSRLLCDRDAELRAWRTTLDVLLARLGRVYLFVNNHYAGCAPETLARLAALYRGEPLPPLDLPAADGRAAAADPDPEEEQP